MNSVILDYAYGFWGDENYILAIVLSKNPRILDIYLVSGEKLGEYDLGEDTIIISLEITNNKIFLVNSVY